MKVSRLQLPGLERACGAARRPSTGLDTRRPRLPAARLQRQPVQFVQVRDANSNLRDRAQIAATRALPGRRSRCGRHSNFWARAHRLVWRSPTDLWRREPPKAHAVATGGLFFLRVPGRSGSRQVGLGRRAPGAGETILSVGWNASFSSQSCPASTWGVNRFRTSPPLTPLLWVSFLLGLKAGRRGSAPTEDSYLRSTPASDTLRPDRNLPQ